MKPFPLEEVSIVNSYFLLFLSTLVALPLIKILSPRRTFMHCIKNYIYIPVLLLCLKCLTLCVKLCSL